MSVERDGQQHMRLAAVRIKQLLFVEMVTIGWETRGTIRCVAGVPAGAVLVNAFVDPEKGDAVYVFYHPTFDVVPEGQHIPTLGVTMGVVHDDMGAELNATPSA